MRTPVDGIQLLTGEQRQREIPALTGLFERSVQATHAFLKADEAAHMSATLPALLMRVPVLAVYCKNGRMVGFACLCGRELDMLFIDPAHMRKGAGTALMQWALAQGADTLTVNEENAPARRFYEHFGFRVTGRSEYDSLGNAHPILWMKRP